MSSTARRLHSSLEAARLPTAWETRCSTKAKLRKRCTNCNGRIVYGLICPRLCILSARRILQSVRPKPLRRRGQESLLSNGGVLSQRKHILAWRDSTGSKGMLIKPPPKCKNSTNCRSVVAVLRRTDPPQTFLPKRRRLLREERIYRTAGFVELKTPAGLSFQIHACTIHWVSAVKWPPSAPHCSPDKLDLTLLSANTQRFS